MSKYFKAVSRVYTVAFEVVKELTHGQIWVVQYRCKYDKDGKGYDFEKTAHKVLITPKGDGSYFSKSNPLFNNRKYTFYPCETLEASRNEKLHAIRQHNLKLWLRMMPETF